MSDEMGLVARLNEEAERLSGHSIDRGSVDAGIASNLASEAAAAIERLVAERAEARDALLAWVRAAEELADRPGMESHFHDVADETLDAVDAAKEAEA